MTLPIDRMNQAVLDATGVLTADPDADFSREADIRVNAYVWRGGGRLATGAPDARTAFDQAAAVVDTLSEIAGWQPKARSDIGACRPDDEDPNWYGTFQVVFSLTSRD